MRANKLLFFCVIINLTGCSALQLEEPAKMTDAELCFLIGYNQEKGDIDRLQEIMNEVKKRESKNLVTLSSDECAVYASTGVKKYNQIINN